MKTVICGLVVIGLELMKANSWAVVPNTVSMLALGLLAYMVVSELYGAFTAAREIRKMNKRF